MLNNNNHQENKKWIPYFKRKDSIYQKHPFLAWSITIIVILVGVWLAHSGIDEMKKDSSYNAGYKSTYQK